MEHAINNGTCYLLHNHPIIVIVKFKHIKELEIYPISISYLSTHQGVTRFGN